jgi:RNA-binding protein
VVLVGQNGVTPEVILAVEEQLAAHELIKIKLAEDTEDRNAAAEELANHTGSELAQVLGRTVLLFKKRQEKSKINV